MNKLLAILSIVFNVGFIGSILGALVSALSFDWLRAVFGIVLALAFLYLSSQLALVRESYKS